jgi:cell fate regulator YaaT (PSP1 superfamily)
MTSTHLVRYGAQGEIGKFTSLDATCFPRHARVILRTRRGLEVGQVLTSPEGSAQGESHTAAEGAILRGMTVEDHLLEARLERMRDEAHAACQSRLDELGLDATLMDVEHLFDGRTLVFHFFGEVSPEVEAVTGQLAEVYESKAEYRSFVDTLTHGCGPGCGTDAATGGGCTSCATGCAVAGACGTTKRKS